MKYFVTIAAVACLLVGESAAMAQVPGPIPLIPPPIAPPPPPLILPPPPPPGPEYSSGYDPRHFDWCAHRYRSYRAYDNTFQPYGGPRTQCYSPFN